MTTIYDLSLIVHTFYANNEDIGVMAICAIMRNRAVPSKFKYDM